MTDQQEEKNPNVKYYMQHLFRVQYGFAKTREDYHQASNRMTGNQAGKIPTSGGQVTCFDRKIDSSNEDDAGNDMCLLCFVDKEKCPSVPVFIALLAHEVNHIKQYILSHRGELRVGDETESYLIQEIMLDALDAYEEFYPDLFNPKQDSIPNDPTA